jgi:hypothetical protein
MPAVNVEIVCEVEIPELKGTFDSEKRILSSEDIQKFVSGVFGEHYLEILVPYDGIHMEFQAKKSDMKKKGAVFEVNYLDGVVELKVSGVFKVNAYSHVVPRIKDNSDKIYVTGLYCGDWPHYGGGFKGFDKDSGKFPVTARLV